MLSFSRSTALIVIDMQKGFEEIAATGLSRNNPSAEHSVERLIQAFRKADFPIFHIRHSSVEADSVFRPERSGFAVMACAREEAGEPVVVKTVNSSFIGTDLEIRLRSSKIDTLVIVGATTNHCVETTARMAGNLGFRVLLVRDAVFTFDRIGVDGERYDAEAIHAMTLSNLNGEFAEIVCAEDVINTLHGAGD